MGGIAPATPSVGRIRMIPYVTSRCCHMPLPGCTSLFCFSRYSVGLFISASPGSLLFLFHTIVCCEFTRNAILACQSLGQIIIKLLNYHHSIAFYHLCTSRPIRRRPWQCADPGPADHRYYHGEHFTHSLHSSIAREPFGLEILPSPSVLQSASEGLPMR